MNGWRFVILLSCFLVASTAWADDDILTGDTRLACEAILCLSSGDRPGECSPSLSRYFGISKKKWKDTLKARRNFLNLCPASSEPDMPMLVESIVNGAGRCTAELLNRTLVKFETVTVCDEHKYWEEDEKRCVEKTIKFIDDTLPQYCRTYADHEYTYRVGVHYVGEKRKGGKWVDE